MSKKCISCKSCFRTKMEIESGTSGFCLSDKAVRRTEIKNVFEDCCSHWNDKLIKNPA